MAKSNFVNPIARSKFKKVIRNEDKLDSSMRTNIKHIPVVNDKIIHDIARLNKMNIADVTEIIRFMGRYTADIIGEGMMETVMLPYFGKFTPDIKALQGMKRRIRDVRSGKFLLELALKGKNINFKPQINPIMYENPEISNESIQMDQKANQGLQLPTSE